MKLKAQIISQSLHLESNLVHGFPLKSYTRTCIPSMSHRTPRGAVVFSNISINFPERFVDVAFIC